MTRIPALLLLLSAAAIVQAQATGEVRIYRCTDAAGTQTLRDTPCPKGQQQSTRDMLRPKDAPTRARAPAPASVPAPRPVPAPVVYLAPPRPMYECTTHEGKRYTSENGDGNPRWVPLWTLGYPMSGRPPHRDADRGSFRPAPPASAAAGRPQQALPTPAPPPAHRHGGLPWPAASGGGTWIRDDCAMLPPAEACARLRDRRDQVRTRFFNAMPSERDVLRVEERGINARLDNDCGGS
ncbi:MAG TPA: DUF4124 domain-containing protein [Thermomonas sp.]|nr:DUF4124 domain-containing protein [Thermomonas sp.]HQX94434.1 DUF4124 domain-containing protein [Thermomonas sp.]HQY83087.1 DUF4124 domain-containing protein [Thermomonas sp.]HRA38467.1 DUF4124 domain-containing protein [Pseudomonadota bacterium]